MNALGLGLVFTAKDMAGGVVRSLESKIISLEGKTSQAAKSFKAGMTTFATGATLIGIGAGGLAALAPATREAGELGLAIAQVATEADLAVFPQARMKEITEALGQTFGQMPVDEAKALYKAVALGAGNAEKATSIMTAANRLAVAGVSDLATTMDALGGTLNAFGMDFSHADEVSDAFFTAMKNGNTTVQELASSVGRVNATAHAMGIGVQEVLGSVAVMTNKGVQASEAVSGLREALSNINHPSKQAKEEAARLGIQFDAASMRAKGLGGFLGMITHNGKFSADTMSRLFTSVEGATAMMQLAENQGAAFTTIMDEMGKSAGATARGFDIINATGAQMSARIEASKKVALGLIGEGLAPITKVVKRIQLGFLEAFNAIPKPIVRVLAMLFYGISTLLIVVGTVLAAKAAIALFSIALTFLGIVLVPILILAAKVAAAIGMVIAIIGFAREVIIRDVGGIGTFLTKMFDRVRLFFDALGQAFSQGGFSGPLMDELNKAENSGIKNFVIKLYAYAFRIQKFFDGISEGFGDFFEPLKGPFKDLVDALGDMFVKIAEMLGITNAKAMGHSDTWKLVGAVIGSVLGAIVRFVVTGFGFVVEAIAFGIKFVNTFMESFEAVGQVVAGVLGFIGGILTGNWAFAWESAKGVVAGVAKFIILQIGFVAESIATLIDRVAGMFHVDLGASDMVRRVRADLQAEVAKFEESGSSASSFAQSTKTTLPEIGSSIVGLLANANKSRPAVAQSESQAAMLGQIPFFLQSGPPTEIHSTVVLDGQVIAEAVDRVNERDQNTGFGATSRGRF